jgi:predicted Abi (CAAX) family protease
MSKTISNEQIAEDDEKIRSNIIKQLTNILVKIDDDPKTSVERLLSLTTKELQQYLNTLKAHFTNQPPTMKQTYLNILLTDYKDDSEIIPLILKKQRSTAISSDVNPLNLNKTMNRLQIQREIILKREAKNLRNMLLITGTLIIGIVMAVIAFTLPLFKIGFRDMTETEINPVSVMTVILVVLILFKYI